MKSLGIPTALGAAFLLAALALALRPRPGEGVALIFASAAKAEAVLLPAAAAGWRPVRIETGVFASLHLLPDPDAAPPDALARAAGAWLAVAGRPAGGCLRAGEATARNPA